MVLLRRVIGDALRARRQGQHRTLREVSTAANVSLGYLSEIERGQKEASSELLSAICEALGARLSEVLGEVSGTLALAEGMDGMEGVLVPLEPAPIESSGAGAVKPAPAKNVKSSDAPAVRQVTSDGSVSVSVRQESPLKATLHATRKRERDIVYAA
ncbi:helix-turn-helix domain-containing protein [Actinoplanes friuliensis]|jgi:transcriptional regulator with XRE-family HTH domain|uniref:XRE family transcriptional regulator n=1 Tax=Actinoplanes friuliensis DSM 7358 TaxID=1246995 RepID=U5WBN6_9ACTN|nr:helix-turn-helix transcriptional regulator [Actinoplanes friuliensis]AGZ45415.1 XRE family transcriptional regulator [Actinoplanes friuliensis DSM 7358]